MDRSRLYKNTGKNNEELRRRRIDQSVELRKAKKEQQLQKRRNVNDVEELSPLKDNHDHLPSLAEYSRLIGLMKDSDLKTVLTAVQATRKVLSKLKNPPIEHFFERGAHKVLSKLLDSDSDEIVFEAAWAITNIASGESRHTRGVVEVGAVPKLLRLVSHPDVRIAEQCIWALGNIAGDGTVYRDMLIQHGVVEPTLQLLERAWSCTNVVSNIAWMLSNLCRNKNPDPPRETILRLLPVFAKLLEYPNSREVVVDTTWALSYISDCSGAYIDEVIFSGCLPTLINFLDSNRIDLVSPALRTIGNLILGTDEQTQAVIDMGMLKHASKLLQSERTTIIKEACWVLSNVTAGNVEQIQAVVDVGVVPLILSLMKESDLKVQKEACWIINNMVIGGTPEHRAYLLNNGILEALGKMLTVTDARILKLVLDILKKIFETAEQYNQLENCCLAFENCGALTLLEQLQDHQNEDVYLAAYNFIAQFFSDTEEGQPEPTGDSKNDTSASNGSALQRISDEFHFKPQPQPGSSNFDF